jgi:hypothetical protein
MNKRTAAGTASAALATTLLLSACGGSGGTSHDIKGAQSSKSGKASAPSSTPSASPASGAPTFDFPHGLTVKIDADATGDKTKDAVLRDHGYALRAILLAYVKQDPGLPLLGEYLAGKALQEYGDDVNAAKKDGKTVTGREFYYDRSVTVEEIKGTPTATVKYCEDQRYAYDKDVKTGKVYKTAPSANSFLAHTDFMEKDSATWKITAVSMDRGAARCQR